MMGDVGRNPWRGAAVYAVVCALLLQAAASFFACPEGLAVPFDAASNSVRFSTDIPSANCLKGAATDAEAALPPSHGNAPGNQPHQDCPACLSFTCYASAIPAPQAAHIPAPSVGAIFLPAPGEALSGAQLAAVRKRDPPFSLQANFQIQASL